MISGKTFKGNFGFLVASLEDIELIKEKISHYDGVEISYMYVK